MYTQYTLKLKDLNKGILKCYCQNCQNEAYAEIVDDGIGPWECHGKGVHHDYRVVTSCCKEPAFEHEFSDVEISVNDFMRDADYGY